MTSRSPLRDPAPGDVIRHGYGSTACDYHVHAVGEGRVRGEIRWPERRPMPVPVAFEYPISHWHRVVAPGASVIEKAPGVGEEVGRG